MKRIRRLPPLRKAATAAVTLLAIPGIGTTQNPPPAGVSESVLVRAAEIEVLVLDAKGRPVTDVTREEFVLTVNGAPWKIDWVLPPAPASKAVDVTAEPKALPEEAKALVAPAPLAHSTVFFVDDLHLNFRSRFMGLHALKVYLGTLPPGEEVALYTFRHRLEIIQRFTRDRAALAAALDRLGGMAPVSLVVHSQAEWAGKSEGALQGLAQTLEALAGRPEPKTLVVLAGYVPSSSWELPNALGSASAFDLATTVRQDAQNAVLARTTILALDPSGITPFGSGADQQAPTTLGVGEAPGAATASISGVPNDSFQAPQGSHMEVGGDAFAVLARETGGARISTTHRLPEDLGAESDLLNARYRIGFTPEAGSSATRAVGVRVTRPGLHVRMASRQGSLSGDALARARFAAGLLSESLPRADFPIRVDPVRPPRGWMNKTLSLEIRIPARELFVEDRGDTLQGHVEVLVTSEDDRGGVGEVRREAVVVQLSKKDASRMDHAFFRLPLTLNIEGKGILLVGVRDTTTNRLGHAKVAYPK